MQDGSVARPGDQQSTTAAAATGGTPGNQPNRPDTFDPPAEIEALDAAQPADERGAFDAADELAPADTPDAADTPAAFDQPSEGERDGYVPAQPVARAAPVSGTPNAAPSGTAPGRHADLGPRDVRRWLSILRPATLVCVVAPVLVATCLLWAEGTTPAVVPVLLTLAAGALLLEGTHVLTAYLDHTRMQRRLAAPWLAAATPRGSVHASALLDAGIYPPDALRVGAVLSALAVLLGAMLGLSAGLPIVLLGGGGVLVAGLYATTHATLKRLWLAEVVVGLALGPGLVAFALLAQRRAPTPFALGVGIALGLYAAAWLESTRLGAPAAATSTSRGTSTSMPTKTAGAGRARLIYAATLVAAYLAILVPALPHGAPHGALAVLVALPVTILPLTGALRSRNPATLTWLGRQTLRAYTVFAFWLAIGLLLGELYLRLLHIFGV